MTELTAAAAGRFRIGGDIAINRLGFGAMRVTGASVWGPPADRAEALRTLRRLPALGVTFIDTADSYGPGVSEELLREALHPYDGLLVATKGGLERPGPGQWVPNGRPDYLRGCVQASLRRLGVQRIDLWQRHVEIVPQRGVRLDEERADARKVGVPERGDCLDHPTILAGNVAGPPVQRIGEGGAGHGRLVRIAQLAHAEQPRGFLAFVPPLRVLAAGVPVHDPGVDDDEAGIRRQWHGLDDQEARVEQDGG